GTSELFFFFQAEDGIRDWSVTGVQTCALPISTIPIRTEDGRKIRRAFVAAPGKKLVSADYSQIELRLLSEVANVPMLRKAFQDEIGRASCRERGEISVVDVSVKKRRGVRSSGR